MTTDEFATRLMTEVESLAHNTTKQERDSLHYVNAEDISAINCFWCIYGRMTGHARNERGNALRADHIKECDCTFIEEVLTVTHLYFPKERLIEVVTKLKTAIENGFAITREFADELATSHPQMIKLGGIYE